MKKQTCGQGQPTNELDALRKSQQLQQLNIVGAIESFRDFTLRKEEAEALSAEKDKFAIFTEQSPIGMALFDEQGKFKYINPKFISMFGYSLDDLPDRNLLFRKDYSGYGLDYVVHEINGNDMNNSAPGVEGTVIYAVTCKGGGEKTIRYSQVGLFTGEYLITCEDITQLKHKDQELKAANQRLMDIIDFLPDATFVIDNKGVVIAWNKSIENMTGVRKEDIMGKGDYIYSLPFYGSPQPILIDIVLDPQKKAKKKYEKLESKEGSLIAEIYVPLVYKGRGATLWGIASLLLDSDGNTVGAIESIRDITDKRDFEENLRYLGLHDALTGLYNRTFFEEEMKRASDGRHDPIGIIVCDLDALKLVNDTIGHNVGDSLLVATAEVIKNNFRKCDIISRIGGDEFAILIPNTSEDAMEEIINRLRGSFNNYNLLNPQLPINISIGYSVGGVVDMATNDLFKEADNRMYRDKLHHSRSARSAIVETLMKALEVRDFITEGHATRLYDYARNLAEIIGMPNRIISELGLLAKFHDIGKVGVPDSILFKQGPLTPLEIVEMRRHCEIGHRIAKSSPDLEPIADWILKHHEWWNGAGYPIGLKGEEIPLECRILAIVDSYDAMTSDRPYRKAMTHEQAINELIKCGGSQFDPYLVSRFIEMFKKRRLVS